MTIKQLHDLYYEFLRIIDGICKKNNIRYYLNSGTLLGAVRHNDFIPWDDDVDLEVPYSEYGRFCDIMKRELLAPYRLVEPADFGDTFYDFTVRIIREDVQLRAESAENEYYHNLQNYLCIDIFTSAPISHRPLVQKWTFLKYKIIYGMAMAHRYSVDLNKYSPFARIQVRVLTTVGQWIPMKHLRNMQMKLNHVYRGAEQDIRSYYITNGLLEEEFFYESSWHSEVTEGIIRETAFPIPSGWHDILTTMYGDYMTPVKMTDRIHADLTVLCPLL